MFLNDSGKTVIIIQNCWLILFRTIYSKNTKATGVLCLFLFIDGPTRWLLILCAWQEDAICLQEMVEDAEEGSNLAPTCCMQSPTSAQNYFHLSE